jgi:DNA-binding beta-propeller fold protein YncE
VVDLEKHSIVGEIPNTAGVHGIALVPALGKGYTSNGRDSSVTVFDLKSLSVIATLKINARNPDAILYDPFSRRVFTFNGGSANATAIDAQSNTVVGSILLGGKPEFGVTDARGRIYVNIEDKSEVVVIDPMSLTAVKRWPLSPGEEPTGLALDREYRRLFAGCGNRLMVILDADSGNVVATTAIGDGVDGVVVDRASHLAFSANGDGTLTVVGQETPSKYAVVENVPTRRSARTLVLDEKTHRIYTVAARFGPPPPPTADRPRPRPTIVPESVTLYTIGR